MTPQNSRDGFACPHDCSACPQDCFAYPRGCSACDIFGETSSPGTILSHTMPKRKSTVTSTFGSPGREGHDSSAFYGTRLYADRVQVGSEAYLENLIGELDLIHQTSCEEMKELPDCSVHLMVTSPPYNVGKDYD